MAGYILPERTAADIFRAARDESAACSATNHRLGRCAYCVGKGARRSAGRRISATEWKAAGGLHNSKLYRRQAPSGRWIYYVAD